MSEQKDFILKLREQRPRWDHEVKALEQENAALKEKLEKSIVMQIEANERCDVLREKLEIAKEALKKVIECSDAGLGEYYLCSCNVPAQEALEKLK